MHSCHVVRIWWLDGFCVCIPAWGSLLCRKVKHQIHILETIIWIYKSLIFFLAFKVKKKVKMQHFRFGRISYASLQHNPNTSIRLSCIIHHTLKWRAVFYFIFSQIKLLPTTVVSYNLLLWNTPSSFFKVHTQPNV